MTIAAFFDLDGTLLPAPSLERRYLRYLDWHGDLRWWKWLRTAARMIPLAARANASWETRDGGESEWAVLVANNKAYLAGVNCSTITAFCGWLQQYPVKLFAQARRRMEWHAQQGHQIVLVSGTLAPLAYAVVRDVCPSAHVLATELESAHGQWTGRVAGKAMAGIEKARAIARFAAERHLHLQNCFAYGDSWADRWMLGRVGHPVAVNPCKQLAKFARRDGWPIVRWDENGPTAAPEQEIPCQDSFVEKLREAARERGCTVTTISRPSSVLAANSSQESNGLHSRSV